MVFPAGSVKFNLSDGVYESSNDPKYALLAPVEVKNGWNVNDLRLRFCSRWSQTTIDEEARKGTTFWVKTQSFAIRAIYAEGKAFNESPREIIFTNGSHAPSTRSSGVKVGTNEEGSAEVDRILGEGKFDYPKPVSLIAYLISLTKADTILDFFAGSSSTAHAVLELNAESNSNRNFIMVQLPEPAAEGTGTLADLSRQRIDLSGEIVKSECLGKNTPGNAPLDIGFRSYKLADTNFTKWRTDSDIDATQLERHLLELRESADDDATPDALLTEILLKQGHSLVEQIRDRDIEGLPYKAVVRVDDEDGEEDTLVLAYLDEHTKPTLAQLRAAMEVKPAQFIMLEDAFQGDDELKTNLAQICKTNGIELWTA